MPNTSPSIMRAPAPAERSEPSTNGIASNTANTIATVRAMRDQKANTYSRASSALAMVVADEAPQRAAGELLGILHRQPEEARRDVGLQQALRRGAAS